MAYKKKPRMKNRTVTNKLKAAKKRKMVKRRLRQSKGENKHSR